MRPPVPLLTAMLGAAALLIPDIGLAEGGGWTPPPELAARLLRGEVYADVERAEDGNSGVVRAAVDIRAPLSVIWGLIQDCGRAARMVPSVVSCQVLQRDPGGRWDIREHQVRWNLFMPPMRSVFRSDYTPMRRIGFHCLATGDLKVCQGEWRLEPLPGGGVRVIYENSAKAPFAAPAFIFRQAMRRDVPDALVALRRESLAAAR